MLLVVFGLLTFFVVYNIQFADGTSLRKLAGLSTSDLVTLLATVVVAYYAYRTTIEMRTDREMNLIERKLSQLYSPLCEILRRAKFETIGERGKLRGDAAWFVLGDELKEMRGMIENCGHYFERSDAEKFIKILDRARESYPGYIFEEEHMGPFYDDILKKRRSLICRLLELA